MNLLLLALLRDYKRYWGKTLLTLLGFIFSLTLFLVIELFVSLLDTSQSTLTMPQITDYVVHDQGRISESIIQKILQNTEIDMWEPSDSCDDLWKASNQFKQIKVRAYNSDKGLGFLLEQHPDISTLDWDEVQPSEPAKGLRHQIILFNYSLESEIKKMTYTSQLAQTDVDVIQVPIKTKGMPVALMDIALYQQYYNTVGYVKEMGIVCEDTDRRLLSTQLAKIDPNLHIRSAAQTTNKQLNWTHSLTYNLKFLALIALIVSISLCMQCFSFIHYKRRNLYKTFTLLGATPFMMVRARILELIFLSIICTILGLAFSLMIASYSLGIFNQLIQTFYFYMDAQQIILTPLLIIKAFGVSVMASLLSCITINSPLRYSQAIRFIIMSILLLGLSFICLVSIINKWTGIAATFLMIGSSCVLAVSLMGVLSSLIQTKTPHTWWRMRLAAESFKKAWQGVGVIVFVIALALGLIFSMIIYVNSFKTSVSTWLDRTLSKDIYIQHRLSTLRQSIPINPLVFQQIQARFKGDIIQTISSQKETWRGKPMTINGISGFFQDRAYAFKATLPKQDPSRDIIVSEPFALKHKKSLGDEVTFPGMIAGPCRIGGITYDYVSEFPTVFVPASRVVSHHALPLHGIAITFQDQQNMSAKLAFLNTLCDRHNLSLQRDIDLKEQSLGVFDDTFAFTWFIVGLTSLLCLFSLVNLLTLICSQRQKELQQLWLLGANKSQLTAIVLAQTRIIVGISGILALMMGVLLYCCIVYGIQRPTFSWSIFIDIPMIMVSMGVLIYILVAEYVTRSTVARLPESFLKSQAGDHEE
ncbi:MAG: ABC transporter permease [bacterium]